MEKGRFTLPGETGMEEEIKKLVNLWGVDAIRDSDGTQLSQELIDMGLTGTAWTEFAVVEIVFY